MAQSLIACPLCSAASFSSTNALCMSLVSVASKWLRCTLCEEELRGIDKLTIHLLGHLTHSPDFNKILTTGNISQGEAKLVLNPEPLNLVKTQNESETISQKPMSEICNSFPFQTKSATDVSERPSLKIDDEVMIFFNASDKTLHNKQNNETKAPENHESSTVTSLPKITLNFNRIIGQQNENTLIPEERHSVLSEGYFGLPSTNQVCDFFLPTGTNNSTIKNPPTAHLDNKSQMALASVDNKRKDTLNFIPEGSNTNSLFGQQSIFNDLEKQSGSRSSFLSPRGERVLGYRCDVCSLVFPEERILLMHRQLIHIELNDDPSKTKSYKCHLCSKSFVMKGSLMVHMRVAHFGGAVVARLVEAKQLETDAVSPDSAQYVCSICNKGFKKEQQLIQHEKLHDGKQCDVCLKTFTTKYFLRKHKRLHTGEMPYSCSVCNKSFTFQQSYHKHLLYHSDDKPYTCAECGRAFKELSTLHNHQRIHTGEKPFSCETCGTVVLLCLLCTLTIEERCDQCTNQT